MKVITGGGVEVVCWWEVDLLPYVAKSVPLAGVQTQAVSNVFFFLRWCKTIGEQYQVVVFFSCILTDGEIL